MPPITLNNRYKYNPDTDLLGEGGLGTVYKAYDVQQERYVAIKKFNVTSNLKHSLRAEFQKSIHFSHGNLVRAYDFFSTYDTLSSGETHETQYGVMELIAGGDLAQYLKTKPPLPELLAVTKGILRGLDYLHTPDPKTDKGIIIHRDIKPANILVFRNNQGKPIPKITDFNIAKDATNEVSTQTAIGTPEYMSPEQYLPPKYGTNGRVMPNADLWALGLLLCDHLLNRSLFGRRNNGQTKGEITHNILSETLPTAEIQKLPAPFNQIVAQCLVHHAPKRVQSAKELLAMIDRYENSVEDTIKVVPPKNKPTPKTYVPKIEDTFKPAARKNNTSTIVLGVMLFCWMLGIGYLLYPTTPKDDVVIADIEKVDTTKTSPATDTTTIATEQPNTNADTPKPTPSTNEQYTQSINEGNTLFVQGSYAQAKTKYEAALQYKPNDKAATDGIKKCNEQLKPKEQPTIAKQTPQETPPPPKPVVTPPPSGGQGGASKPYIKMISIPGKNLKMSETEVTIGQYLAFCKATNSHWPSWLEQGSEYNIRTGTDKGYQQIGMSESNTNYPITGVSATDADAFCRWMGGRLPTEQEWEYAAKGGQGYEYAGSDDINEVAWYDDNSGGKAHPVKQKQANGYGLYDMSGNVWEWTSSTEGSRRVLSGGSWDNRAAYCRVAIRVYFTPAHRIIIFGFRLAVR